MTKFCHASAKGVRGFTLVEIMCVLVLVSILALVALPAYRHQFLALGRMQAVIALREVSQRQQVFYAQYRRYSVAMQGLGYTQGPFAIDRFGRVRAPDSAQRIYLISLSTQNGGYAVTAQPQLLQAKHSRCGTLSLSARGEVGVTGVEGVKQCWR